MEISDQVRRRLAKSFHKLFSESRDIIVPIIRLELISEQAHSVKMNYIMFRASKAQHAC